MPMRPPFVPGGGGGGGGSTVIWSVDFSTEPDHDFLSTAALSLGGVTWTAQGTAKATQFEISSGALLINPVTGSGHAGTTDNAPELRASFPDLMTYGAKSGSWDAEKTYVLRAILSSSSAYSKGGPVMGMMEAKGTADKDLSLQRDGYNWRFVKGGTKYYDVNQASTGVTGNFRTLAVKFGQGSWSAMSSDTDTHEGEAFGGVPVYVGYVRPATRTGLIDANYTYIPGSPLMNLGAVGAQAYVGAWVWSGGAPGVISYSRIELHEVG